uniref:Uncharacterized protein n=1 Tax=Anguilla anguilla TaxID=7936 RepID=A0A0E9UJM9_ANGAN
MNSSSSKKRKNAEPYYLSGTCWLAWLLRTWEHLKLWSSSLGKLFQVSCWQD